MTKLIYIFIFTLTLFSCVDEEYKPYKKFRGKNIHHNRGGAIDNFGEVNRVSRRVQLKPLENINVASLKKEAKSSNLNSINPNNYEEIEDEELSEYNDFDDIFENGRYVGVYKIGNQYEIEGVPYYPQEYDFYEEVGVASWYGEEFDGKKTANGEIYNLNQLTAAHQTLPLPSIARVTNLKNNKSVLVRVNDRGPFAKNRIIDLSKKAAEILGYRDIGTANVKVEYLPEETEKLLQTLKIKR